MADRIKLLPEVVANQIAAGEVVNRPSSVVKEMMENAVDAGAHSVKVNFRDGGKELIQIIDDGCGMSPVDAQLAFDRHATSKIQSVDDIYQLSTFGFRGEALPSIAAVAEVEVRSRQEDDELGTKTEIKGGEFVGQSPVMCPVGSQFFVRNLFYNVPARRRFLDKSTTSASHIKTEFRRVALCYPDIEFELYANDAPVYTLKPGTLANRIVDVVGRHIKHNLLEVGAETSIASISGYIGRPQAAKRRNTDQYLFVNGRYFKSNYLVSAILKAYEKLMPQNTQPAYFLYLTINPERVDVNVHPQKTEVKFSDEEALWQIVNAAVRETLAKTGAVPMMDFEAEEVVEIPVLNKEGVYTEPKAMQNSSYNPFNEDYIDHSSFNPEEPFTGFDMPRQGTGRALDDVVSVVGRDMEFVSSAADFGEVEGVEHHRDMGLDAEDRSYKIPTSDVEDIPSGEDFMGVDDVASQQMGDEMMMGGRKLNDFPPIKPQDRVRNTTSVPRQVVHGEEFEDFASDDDFRDIASEDDESELEFVASEMEAQVQQLDMGIQAQFTDITSLTGGVLLALMNGRLVVVDARRAKERILYDDYLKMLGHGTSVSQQLLFPERVVLSNEEYALLEERAVDFAALGFDLEFKGEGAVDLKGTPAEIPSEAVDQLLYELLQAFSAPVDLEEVRRQRIAQAMARQGAKTLPRKLKKEEAETLLHQLSESSNLSFSPQGKAIVAEITMADLKAKLG